MLFALGLSLALSAPGGAQNLHPTLSAKVEQLVERSAAAGVPITLISGYRRFDPHGARAKQGKASWHNFGLAIDVNLRGRKSMADALAHYDQDKRKWATVGRIGQEVGLTWGAPWGRAEIFHFEWHPGAPAAIRKDTLDSLLAEAGRDGKGFKQTWHRFGGVKGPAVARGKSAKARKSAKGRKAAKGETIAQRGARAKAARGAKRRTAKGRRSSGRAIRDRVAQGRRARKRRGLAKRRKADRLARKPAKRVGRRKRPG